MSEINVDKIISSLGENIRYKEKDQSFSPFFSDIGLGFDSRLCGISTLFLHYNRKTIPLGEPFAEIVAADMLDTACGFLSVRQKMQAGKVEYAFYGRNSWILQAEEVKEIRVDLNFARSCELRITQEADACILAEFLVRTIDERDPDIYLPVILGFRAIEGTCVIGADHVAVFSGNDEGGLLAAFTVQLLDGSVDAAHAILDKAPGSLQGALRKSRRWMRDSLRDFGELPFDGPDAPLLAKAVQTMLFNCCESVGMLRGRVSCFPSRGGYPTQFLWDTCFQNLALERMNPRLAEDSILVLTQNIRCDGKIPSFLCSTWMRSHDTQPPLIGWAALRLIRQTGNMKFARAILPKLVHNIDWWLSQRMSRFGVAFCPHPIETGWDNSPRFDSGPILPLDNNCYLLMQIDACREIASMLHDDPLSRSLEKKAAELSAAVQKLFYDENENIYFERRQVDGEPVRIKTPACFLPLLAGVALPEEQAKRMIETYLLEEDLFNGKIPMPSVAYDESAYSPSDWWRGPMWLPVAYLMLELLQKYGYLQQREEIARKLYHTILNDGELSELFNSRTGEGMGFKQQGWTAAIAIRLKYEYPDIHL